MNISMIFDHLNQMNEEELFYKQYYHSRQSPDILAQFLASLDPIELEARGLIVPDVIPERIPQAMSDDQYFNINETTSVYLSKHSRYTPVFEHTHIFFEIIYVLSGTCTHHIFHQNMELKEGDLCLISPSVQHSLQVNDDHSIIINILMRRSTIEDIFFNVLRDNSIISEFFLSSIYIKNHAAYLLFHTQEDLEIRNLILEMFLEQYLNHEYSDRIISSMLIIFFSKLVRKHKHTVESPTTANHHDTSLLAYISEHYAAITLSQLAKHLNFSVPYCSAYVKKNTGYSFLQLVRKIRFQHAEMLLTSTNISIHCISLRLGYENPENFMRAFKKEYGMTPSSYRNHTH